MKTSFKFSLSGFLLALALLCAPALKAQVFSFNVDLNTAALSGDTTPPFFLDLQLNTGDGTLPSTVTFGNFQFTGGSATGSPVLTGSASGSLSSSVSLNDATNALNEFYQGFTAGTTDIKFTATVSQNFTGVSPAGIAVSILDNAFGSPAQIYTTSPDSLSLVTLSLSASNTLSDVQAFSSALPSPEGITATITAIPEPCYTVALLGGMVSAFAAVRRIKTRRLA
jgi:hypothetical protein